MCGICGIFNFNNKSGIDTDLLSRMCKALEHRGPDGEGQYLGHEIGDGVFMVGLGHRRLAIVDSQTGQQPIHNENETVWVTCNGEIYNFDELKDTCLKNGHKFYTKSDSEIILHLYEDYGIDCVKYLRGMFAFAIWDEAKRMLFLARDRLGIKPLYYSYCNNNFIFASEIKAILLHPLIKRRVNWESFQHYFAFSSVLAPFSLFEGIYKLPPGHTMRIFEDGHYIKEEYWDLLDNKNRINFKSENDYLCYLYDLFEDVIKCHRAEGVPQGVFLSGGVDSSLVTGLLSKYVNPLKTFTAGFKESHFYSEFEFAHKISKLFNTEHYDIFLKKDNFDDTVLRKLMYYQEEPFSVSNILYYFTSKLAKSKKILIMFLGDGSDELFGYPFWMKILKFRKYLNYFSQMPNFFQISSLKLLELFLGKYDFKYEIATRVYRKQTIFWGLFDSISFHENELLFSKKIDDNFDKKAPFEIVNRYYKKFMDSRFSNNYDIFMAYVEIKMRLPETFLMWRDRMSMANSIEIRVPFLDHKLAEAVINIPNKLKFKNNIPKYPLKKMSESIIPKEILYRNKMAGSIGTMQYYSSLINDKIKERILSFNKRNNFFNLKFIEELFHRNKNLVNHRKIWSILSFICWYEMWIESE